MVDTRLALGDESPEGSSNENVNVGMDLNPPQGQEQPPVEAAPEPVAPVVQNVQRECLLSMKGMFDQIVSDMRQGRLTVPVDATSSRAPIEKLARYRAYTFAGVNEEKPEEPEQWLEMTTQILTKQLQCSDEHKLECAISLLADEALSWWETTTLTAPTDSVTWNFFVEEFKKKYISEQYLAERRRRFLYLKQANRPIEQYVVDFCKYCKYGAEYIKTEKQKCQMFIDGLNDEMSPMFTALGITDFQILVNRAIATEAKMKASEKRKGENRDDKKRKWEDKPDWKVKL